MKKYLLLIALTWFITNAFSQMPQAFNYQAVARDLTGNPTNDITNEAVTLTLAASAVFPGTLSASASKILVTQMSPTVNAGFDQFICEGQTAQLNGSASNYSSISWTGNVSNPGILNPVYTPTSADIAAGFAELCLTAYPIFPETIEATDCVTIYFIGYPVVNAGYDATIGTETFTTNPTVYNATQVYWYSNGDGFFDDETSAITVYYPGLGDIAAGSVELCLLAIGFGPCQLPVEDCLVLTFNATPTANAGIDATIWEGNTYQLAGVATHYSAVEWNTSGDGTFNDENILNPAYTPGAADIAAGSAELCLTAYSIPPQTIATTDCLIITIISLPEVFAGNDATINEGEDYSLTGTMADHCSSLLWSTSGDGSFNNATLLNPEYTPGTGDITEGVVELCLTGYNEIGETTDCMTLTFYDRHFITLPEGWTSISSYLVPNNQEVAQLMVAIEEKLIILSDFEGNIYQPDNKNLINWDFTKGYYIKMASPDTLQIVGLYPMNKQLELQEGWNLIPVLSDAALAIEDLFYSNLQKVEIITEVAGVNVYWPEHEIATLQQLMPGKAYLVKASEPFLLPKLPDVTTTSLSNIAGFTATSGGSATNEGSWPVTSRGIVWSTTENPTISNYDGITNDGDGSGNWVSELTGLIPFTTYYVRAYATNYFGTAFGEELMFTTSFGCGYTFTDSRDGKIYTTVQIGTQCWMAQNLNVGTRITGTTGQTNNNIIEKYCYNNNEANCDVYGGLYQWNEMMAYSTTPGVQGICPPTGGWHLPTDAEWTTLTTYLGGESVAGGKMKETDTTHWASPNTGATNSSGFRGLPGGSRNTNGAFNIIGYYGYFWSSTQYSAANAWSRNLGYYDAYVYRVYFTDGYGFSVRCLRD